MNSVLEAWNRADEASAFNAMISCCGARRWAAAMIATRPIDGQKALHQAADRAWDATGVEDWMEAIACHPRIGERNAAHASTQSAAWSRQEQSAAGAATSSILSLLAEENARYEEKFGFTYIVCATGKTVEEMLTILRRRLASDRDSELREAAEQQRQIMHIRLEKWLAA